MRYKLLLMLLTVTLAVCIYRGYMKPGPLVSRLSSYAAYPLLVAHARIVAPCTTWFKTRKTIAELDELLEIACAENEQLTSENYALRAQLAYVGDVNDLYEFAKRYSDARATIAQVLVRHMSDQGHFILIDAGSNRGIAKDMVVVHGSTLIGRVEEVYPWYSKVCLITDKSCKVSVYGEASKAQGIHEGDNMTAHTKLSYASHLTPVEPGELLFSSGEGLLFPRGFAVGRVETVEPGLLYHDVMVTPLCDPNCLQYCQVLSQQ